MFPDFCQVGSTCLNVFVKSDFYISTSFTYILTSTAASYKVNYVTLKMGRLPIFKLKNIPESSETVSKSKVNTPTFNLGQARV